MLALPLISEMSAMHVSFWRRSETWIDDDKLTLESDSLLHGVNLLGLSLINRDLALLVPGNVPSGLDDTSGLKSTDSHRGQKRSEKEVVSGRDDDDVEFVGVEALEEGGGTPTGTKDNKGRLRGVAVELLSGVTLGVSHCVQEKKSVEPRFGQNDCWYIP